MSDAVKAAPASSPLPLGTADISQATVLLEHVFGDRKHLVVESDGQLQQLFINDNHADVAALAGDDLLELLRTVHALPPSLDSVVKGATSAFKEATPFVVVFEITSPAGEPVAQIKFCRHLEYGTHPEVELLSAAAFPQAQSLLGDISATVNGQQLVLGCVTEPITGESTSEVFKDFVRAGIYSEEWCAKFGTTIRMMHDAMHMGFGAGTVPVQEYRELLHERVDRAVEGHDDLAEHTHWVHELIDTLTKDVSVQRVHGMLTLSNVYTDYRNISVANFGGNPAAPFSYRRQLVSAAWDVATVITSIELTAGTGPWTESVISAFLRGYEYDAEPALLDAHLAIMYIKLLTSQKDAVENPQADPRELLSTVGKRHRGLAGSQIAI